MVYGDTDSLFVQVKGATRVQAFELGREIVRQVGLRHPAPMKLKLEKVYQPCFLLTKKRFVVRKKSVEVGEDSIGRLSARFF